MGSCIRVVIVYGERNVPVVVGSVPGVGQAGHGLLAGLGRDGLGGGASGCGHREGVRGPGARSQRVHTTDLRDEGWG